MKVYNGEKTTKAKNTDYKTNTYLKKVKEKREQAQSHINQKENEKNFRITKSVNIIIEMCVRVKKLTKES